MIFPINKLACVVGFSITLFFRLTFYVTTFLSRMQFRPKEGLYLEKHFCADWFYNQYCNRWLKPTAKDSTMNVRFSQLEHYPCLVQLEDNNTINPNTSLYFPHKKSNRSKTFSWPVSLNYTKKGMNLFTPFLTKPNLFSMKKN